MSESFLRADVFLPHLGEGSGYFLMAFRGMVFGPTGCRCLSRVYDNVFGSSGEPLLSDIKLLACQLGTAGRRKVRLAMPGCARLSHDEVSLLSALKAAQIADWDLQQAHMSWLLGQTAPAELRNLSENIATHFLTKGLVIQIPPSPAPEKNGAINKAALGVVGVA